jgi:hypothetical protein
MTNTKQFTTWQEIRAEEKRLSEEYSARREELSRLEAQIREDAREKRIEKAKAAGAPPVQAWKLTAKNWSGCEEGSPWIFTVRYADGTGNSYSSPRGTYDDVTGAPLPGWDKVELYAYFTEGLPFEEEPSCWLNEHRFYDIVEIDVADLPPIKRF